MSSRVFVDIYAGVAPMYAIVIYLQHIVAVFVEDTMGQGGRRRFLTGGAVAAVGSVAAGVISQTVEAAENSSQPGVPIGKCPPLGKCPPGVSYHPNDSLAHAIVRAWTDESFKKRLLTFPEHTAPDWSKFADEDRQKMIGATRDALAEVEIFLDSPVVLTPDQFGQYRPKDDSEVIFVLPSPSIVYGKRYTLDTARVAMALCPFGM